MLLRILLVDASSGQRDALELALDARQWSVSPAPDARSALAALEREHFDVAICADSVAGLDGFDLVPQLRRRQPHLQVLLGCAPERADRHELAARVGAAAVVARPLHPPELRLALLQATRIAHDRHCLSITQRDLAQAVGDKPIVAASEPMIDLLEAMERAAGFKTPAVLLGEPGTHREVLARAIHAQSARRSAPFVAIRCAAAKPAVVEAQLFGASSPRSPSRTSAGLVHQADGGTAYFDDLMALSAGAQQRLLCLLETAGIPTSTAADKPHEIDVRLIFASTRPLAEGVERGLLRPDLGERLASVVLEVPPLRARRADLPLLVDHELARLRGDLASAVEGMSDAAMERLVDYHWPGNLRELENVMERAVLLASSDRITVQDLPATLSAQAGADGQGSDFSLRRARRSFEADMIRRALARTHGNRTRAAKLLEISHRALLYKIKEYGLRD